MKTLKRNLLDINKNVEAICIPVNSSVDSADCSILNEQLASDMWRKFSFFSRLLGNCFLGKVQTFTGKKPDRKNALVRNLFTTPIKNQPVKIITVQTRETYLSVSTIHMIERATKELVKLVDALGINCVWLPVLGTGRGGLDRLLVIRTIRKILDGRFYLILDKDILKRKEMPKEHNKIVDPWAGPTDWFIAETPPAHRDTTGALIQEEEEE